MFSCLLSISDVFKTKTGCRPKRSVIFEFGSGNEAERHTDVMDFVPFYVKNRWKTSEKYEEMDIPLRKKCVFVVFLYIFGVWYKARAKLSCLFILTSPNPRVVSFLFLYWYFYFGRMKICLEIWVIDLHMKACTVKKWKPWSRGAAEAAGGSLPHVLHVSLTSFGKCVGRSSCRLIYTVYFSGIHLVHFHTIFFKTILYHEELRLHLIGRSPSSRFVRCVCRFGRLSIKSGFRWGSDHLSCF